MNKDKIREALERIANDTSPNSLPIDAAMEGPNGLTVRAIADRCFDDAREALAELDKAPKVLTDDMVNTVVNLEKKLHLRENGSDKEADIWARGVMSGMIQARDNGYLAPAAGLTVEEFMDIHRKWLDDVHCYEDWNTNAFTDLRALLTAAIEAKNRKVK